VVQEVVRLGLGNFGGVMFWDVSFSPPFFRADFLEGML
jgi:hypothetical protein